jgi:23S rRNA (cytidine2498-2'-O)-methyltransferase
LALSEIKRQHRDIRFVEQLDPFSLLIQTNEPFDNFILPWRDKLPIYLHHVFPVDSTFSFPLTDKGLKRFKGAIQKLTPAGASLQIRSSSERPEIQRLLEVSAAPPSKEVVSILLVDSQQGFCAYMGVSRAEQNLSPYPGGQIPITEPVSNRAGYKLLEALEVFSIRLRNGNHALDLGAAPGAWTTLLRRRGLKVTAVAPTPLYPWLMFDSEVHYEPMTAEGYLGQCQTTFDLLVNDMKLDPQDSARLMVDYAPHLRSEGIALMTLKMRSRSQERVMDHTFRLLRKAYKIIRVRQLVSNRNEVTLFLRRKR